MNRDEKQFVLAVELDLFREWQYADLAKAIDHTRQTCSRLHQVDRDYDDGTFYQITIEVFWDGRMGGNIRVCGDLSAQPHMVLSGSTQIYFPDVTDSFIMDSDGNFIGE